jgi:hypothetical protein
MATEWKIKTLKLCVQILSLTNMYKYTNRNATQNYM